MSTLPRIERISPSNERAALEYLAAHPYVNVFIAYLVLYDFAPVTRNKLALAMRGTEICGAGYFGRQLAVTGEEDALDAFAQHAKRHRGERMILGERGTIASFWDRIATWHASPRIVRDRQLVMSIDRDKLKSYERTVTVRKARLDEWPAVADTSAQMIQQELEYDPRRTSPDFTSGVRQMIERDLWWVGESYGRLCFFCNIGPWCRQTAQLQGIWTPPELRGKGLATSALAGICEKLLEFTPTLSLYVNDFNRDAIALYERVGFEHVADYRTLLF